jgi:hypothetical protein
MYVFSICKQYKPKVMVILLINFENPVMISGAIRKTEVYRKRLRLKHLFSDADKLCKVR